MKTVIDVLTGRELQVSENELMFMECRTDGYILSIPHAGTFVPKKIAHKLWIGKQMLLRTDMYTDAVYDTGKGIKVVSNINKHVMNANRFKNPDFELLPPNLRNGVFYSKVGGFLRQEYTSKEKTEIIGLYEKYNSFIRKAINQMKKKHGFALLFDCHSMNSIGLKGAVDEGKVRPDFDIGTVNDASAHCKLIECFCRILKSEAETFGFSVRKNYPYSGGAIIRKYGCPSKNVHAIQIEIKKSIYMDEELNTRRRKFRRKPDRIKKLNKIMTNVFKAVSDEAKQLLM